MLRSHETCASEQALIRTCWNCLASLFPLAFVCIALVAVAAPVASAAPGDPEQAAPPQELWNAFPLNPNSQRLGSVAGPKASFTPPGRPQTVAETPPEASRSDLPVLALAGGAGALIFLALLGLAAVRLRHVAGHRRRSSTPLWQGCLLYTSDAADDSLRVDLGGRRIGCLGSGRRLTSPAMGLEGRVSGASTSA